MSGYNVHKVGDYWHGYRRVDGKLRSRTTGCKDRKAAEAVMRRWEREDADPFHAAGRSETIGDWAVKTLEALRRRGRAAGSLNMYRCKLGHIVRVFGATRPLQDLERSEAIDAYISTREREWAVAPHDPEFVDGKLKRQGRPGRRTAPSTIHKELVALRQLLKLARRARKFGVEPSAVMPIGFSPQYKPRTRFLTEEEAVLLLDEAGLPAKRSAMVAYILATSACASEVMRARREHVQLALSHTTVEGTKRHTRRRSVAITVLSRPLLTRALRDAPGEDLLFEPWANVWRDLRDACARVGIAPVSQNDLRRTCASWLVQRGVPLDLVARTLGHSSTNMVERVYGHLRPHHTTQLIDRALMDFDRSSDRGGDAEALNAFDALTFGLGNSREMVGPTGLEPVTDGLKGPRTESPLGPKDRVFQSDAIPGLTDSGDAEPPSTFGELIARAMDATALELLGAVRASIVRGAS